jgi:hypothetical protein
MANARSHPALLFALFAATSTRLLDSHDLALPSAVEQICRLNKQ